MSTLFNFTSESKNFLTMKTIKKLLALSLLTIFVGCGQGKNMTSSRDNTTTSTDATYNSNTSSTTSDSQTMNRLDQDMNQNEQISERSGNNIRETDIMTTNSWDNPSPKMLERRSRMYSDLAMTQEQINTYESEVRSSMNKWQKDNGTRKMSITERSRHDDQALRTILNPSQYAQYQAWAKRNPYDN